MRKEIYENQESSDTLPFHWEFGKEEITLKVSSYAYGNGLAVLMYSQSEGELELFSDLTVNLPGGYGLSRLARYDREGVEEFCRQWGLDIPKEQEKVQGKPTGKKKRERER